MTTNEPDSNVHLAPQLPAKRVADAQDMCGAVVFLVSRAGAYVNGRHIRSEGGFLLKFPNSLSNPE